MKIYTLPIIAPFVMIGCINFPPEGLGRTETDGSSDNDEVSETSESSTIEDASSDSVSDLESEDATGTSEVDDESTETSDTDESTETTPDTCGDGMIQAEEVCDGSELNGLTCESEGFGGGVLGCSRDCLELDTSLCIDGIPGGTCCDAHATPGCSDPSIEQCVCIDQFDAYCCQGSWDMFCVDKAEEFCSAVCE